MAKMTATPKTIVHNVPAVLSSVATSCAVRPAGVGISAMVRPVAKGTHTMHDRRTAGAHPRRGRAAAPVFRSCKADRIPRPAHRTEITTAGMTVVTAGRYGSMFHPNVRASSAARPSITVVTRRISVYASRESRMATTSPRASPLLIRQPSPVRVGTTGETGCSARHRLSRSGSSGGSELTFRR